MINIGKKRIYRTVIMDASNEYIVGRISGMQMSLCNSDLKFAQMLLSKNHPSSRVLITDTTKRQYEKFCDMVEKTYPGLCVFDAPI